MDSCPFCHAPASELGTGAPPSYECGTLGKSRSLKCKVAVTLKMMDRHLHPSVTTSPQVLAGLVIRELGGA